MTGYIYRDTLTHAFTEKKTVVVYTGDDCSFRGKLIELTKKGGILRRVTANPSRPVEHFNFRLCDVQGLTLLR